jgi:hypothetical protein
MRRWLPTFGSKIRLYFSMAARDLRVSCHQIPIVSVGLMSSLSVAGCLVDVS